MPAWRLNDVPLALTFATHFYFTTYHTFSNLMLRKIETTWRPSSARAVFTAASVVAFAYFTAFMETFTISAYPDYSFEDRRDARTPPVRVLSMPVRAAAYACGARAGHGPPYGLAMAEQWPPPTLRSVAVSAGSWRTPLAPPSMASTSSSPSP